MLSINEVPLRHQAGGVSWAGQQAYAGVTKFQTFSADLNRLILLKNIFLIILDVIEEKIISLTKDEFVCKSKFNPDFY